MQLHKHTVEFRAITDELLQHDDVRALGQFSQHMNTNRLEHSMNVAYFSYLICKKLNLDYRSAARAGLLHDLFLYNWRDMNQRAGTHAKAHPHVALKNARCITVLNPIEEDAIVKHMWPMTLRMPHYVESMIVSLADKYSTCLEVGGQSAKIAKTKFEFLRLRKKKSG